MKITDLVTAFNVFAHSDNLHDIATNVEGLLKEKGTFIFEVQYLVANMKLGIVDNIYHEHVNYWTLFSIEKFFQQHGMIVYKIEEVDTMEVLSEFTAQKIKIKKLTKV